jgi:putative DNA primase/helicase
MPRTGVPELLPLVVVPEDDAQTVVLRPAEINDDDDDDDDDDDPPVPQQPFGRDTRPVVRIRDNEMSDVVAETCTHLAAADLGLFDRAHTLVHVLEDAGPTAVPGITTTFFTMARLSPHTLWSAMAKAAAFQNYDGRKRRWKNTKPPEKIAHVIIDSPDAWSFPKLDAIHSCQTLREDGSVVMHDGYDPGMRTLFRDLPALAPLPEDITYQHAQTALALLADLLKEFPFVDNEPDGSVKSGRDSASFAAAVAALMTAVLRPMLGSVPLFALTSSEPGSGKSYLWDCLSMIVSGDACPVIGAAISPEETDKQLSSALMDGRPLICFDNVNGAFGSSLICQANSQPRITLRVLGASELKTIRNRTLMLATGNNIRIRDDLVRRTLLITLDARMENPEKREFAQNPLAMITADRGAYIRACLIIARWYADIGLLDKLLPIGGYGAWSDHVRSALVALGLADPWLTQETARNTDPVREARREVLGHLHRAFGEHPTTVADMLTVAETDAELKQALTGGCAGPRGVLSSQSLRGWLMRNKSTRRDGFLLAATQPQTRHKGAGVFWTVMLTNSAPLSLFPESDHRGQQDL